MDLQKLISHMPVDTSPLAEGERIQLELVGNEYPPSGEGWRPYMAGKFNTLWVRMTVKND